MNHNSHIGRLHFNLTAIVFLLLVGLLSSMLSVVDAGHANAQESDDSEQQSEATRTEVVGQRSETRKVFTEADGSHTAEIYAGPIHYRDDGSWEEIDNSLVPSSRPGYAYENKANSYKVYVPENVDGAPIRIETGASWVEFQLQGATGDAAVSGSTVTYADVLPGVDLSYEATATGVEETLVLEAPQAVLPDGNQSAETNGGGVDTSEDSLTPEPFVFSIDTSKNISLDEVSSGAIELETPGNKVLAELEPPYAFDEADGEEAATTEAVDFDLTETNSQTTVAVVPDAEWLLDPARDWPVVIDPTTTLNPTGNCWIGNGSVVNSSNCGSSSNYIRVGRTTGGDKRRGLMRFDLSGIPSNAFISSADLDLYLDASQTTGAGNATDYVLRRVQKDWSSPVTWIKYNSSTNWADAGGDFGSIDYGRKNLGGSTGGYKTFDTTEFVRTVIDGSPSNYGLIVKQDGETVNNLLYFYSSNSSDSSKWPKLVVSYGSASLDVTTWDRDTDTGTANYDVTAGASGLAVNGGPCDEVTCRYEVKGYRREGSTDQPQATLASEPLAANTNSFSAPLSGSLSREITDLKVEVFPTCSPCFEPHERYESSWIHVSNLYPDGEVYISVNSWETDEDGEVSYDLTVNAVGAAQEGGPCEPSCYSKVYYRESEGQPSLDLASANHPGGTWSFTDNFTGVLSHEASEIKAEVRPCSGCYGAGLITPWLPLPSGLDLDRYGVALAAAYATMSAPEFCSPLVGRGFGSFDGDTLPDVYEACQLLVEAGGSITFVIEQLLGEPDGEEALDALVEEHARGEPIPSQEEQTSPSPPWTPPPGWQDNGCNWVIPKETIELAAPKIERDHVWGAGRRKSEFYAGVSWRWLAEKDAPKEPPRPSVWPGSKYCVRRVEYGRDVGIERATDGTLIGPTNVYTVLTFKSTGNLFNMYPGEPAEDR